MATIKFDGAFKILPEGVQKLMVTHVETKPRDGEPQEVRIQCVNPNGIEWENRYQLPRGSRALYVLVTKGLGMTPPEDFDPQTMVGRAFEAEIVHNTSDRGNTFANLGDILGPTTPWGAAADDDDFDDPEDDPYV